MTTPAARTKAKGTRGHGKRLSERPKLLFVFATGFSLIIGLVNGAIDFPLGGILGFGVFLALVIVILSAAALAVVAAVGSIKREELDVEFWLFFAGPIAGVIIFVPVSCAYVLGLFVPYMFGLEEYDGGDAFSHWAGPLVIFLVGAVVLGLIIGAPVGLVAWASRFGRADLDPLLRRIPDLPWPWRIGLGVPLLLGLALALGALISWLAEGYHRPDTLEAGRVEEFTVGEPRLFEEEDVWVVRVAGGPALSGSEFAALYDRGLVTGCPLQWRREFKFEGRRGWFVDACNGAVYDLNGVCASDPCRGIRLDRFLVSVYGVSGHDNTVVVDLDEVFQDPSAGETLGPTIPAETPYFPTPTR